MEISINEKFYKLIYPDGSFKIVRRDTYWDSGYKDIRQEQDCSIIESALSLLGDIK